MTSSNNFIVVYLFPIVIPLESHLLVLFYYFTGLFCDTTIAVFKRPLCINRNRNGGFVFLGMELVMRYCESPRALSIFKRKE